MADDSNGITVYNIPTPAVVKPNDELVNNFANSLVGSNSASAVANLKSASLQATSSFVNSLTLMLNSQSANAASNSSNNVYSFIIMNF